jgi:hypothetical protein
MEKKSSAYQAELRITSKVVNPQSPYFGKKGHSYFVKEENQWYFVPKGKTDEDAIRVKWYSLDTNIVADESYGVGVYNGMNPEIYGKTGEVFYKPIVLEDDEGNETKELSWVFNFEGEEYRINNPDSVQING